MNACPGTEMGIENLDFQNEEKFDEDIIQEGDAVCFHISNGIQFIITITPDNYYKNGKRIIRMMDCVGHKYGTIFEARPCTISKSEEEVDETTKKSKKDNNGHSKKKSEKISETFVATNLSNIFEDINVEDFGISLNDEIRQYSLEGLLAEDNLLNQEDDKDHEDMAEEDGEIERGGEIQEQRKRGRNGRQGNFIRGFRKDNRNLVANQNNQQLALPQIEAMRKEGKSGVDIIKELIKHSATWDEKTNFSKLKWLNKKLGRYILRGRVTKCTALSVAESVYNQRKSVPTVEKTSCYVRTDTLSQILNFGNIHAESRIMVWDGCGGVVLGAIIERMYQPHLQTMERSKDKEENIYVRPGTIYNLFTGKNCGLTESILPRNYNYKAKKELSIVENIATQDIERMKMTTEEFCESVNKDINAPIDMIKSGNTTYDIKMKRKKKLMNMNEQRKGLQKGVETIIFAGRANYEDFILDLMMSFLKSSGNLIIYCDCVEPLIKLFDTLRPLKWIINLQLTSTWLREIQVLPGRTHPTNIMTTDGGYILSCIKIDLLDTEKFKGYLSSHRQGASYGSNRKEISSDNRKENKKRSHTDTIEVNTQDKESDTNQEREMDENHDIVDTQKKEDANVNAKKQKLQDVVVNNVNKEVDQAVEEDFFNNVGPK